REELRGPLDEVAGEDGREELDALVRAEESLVAVEADQELGGQIAEEREHARSVHELPGVMRVVCAHAKAKRDLEAYHSPIRSMSPDALGQPRQGRVQEPK